MLHTSFRDRSSLLTALQEANLNIKEKLSKINIAMSESLYPLEKNSYHFVTRMLKSNNRVERTLYSLIYTAAYQSELLSAGSSYVALLFATAFLDNLMKQEEEFLNTNENDLVAEYNKSTQKLRDLITSVSKPPSFELLEKHIGNVCGGDKLLSQAILQALEIAGLEGKIHVADSVQPTYMVEMKAGYAFNLKPFKFFLNEVGIWEARNVKVLIVDGLLETVSELDKILNKSAETKIPMLLVAQGFSEEVVATLKMNTDRGAFNIIPVRLGVDLEGLNVANDVATVCGTDVVSALKGEMVMFVDYDTLPLVDLVRCTDREVMIEHGSTRGMVSQHIRGLLEKRNENHAIEDVNTLYDSRIKSLISNAVVIRLPNMAETKKESVRVRIDVALRTCKAMLNYGIVNNTNVMNWFLPTTPMDKIIKVSLIDVAREVEECSSLSTYAGMSIVGKTILSMMCSRGFVENDVT